MSTNTVANPVVFPRVVSTLTVAIGIRRARNCVTLIPMLLLHLSM